MRLLLGSLLMSVSVLLGVGQFTGGGLSYSTAYAEVKSVVVERPVRVSYARGRTTLQGQPCDDERGGVNYSSEIVSRAEMAHEIRLAGFTGERVEHMLAISLAEGGRQVSCIADEHLADAKWGISYGVYSIRTLNGERGTGTCRDIERLRDDLHEQTVCAFEISGQGRTLQPWSTWTNGRWNKFVGQ